MPHADCDISAVRRFGCGAAPLSPEVARAFSKYVGSPLLEGYGLTEASGLTHCNPYDGEQRVGSIGLRGPYVESKAFRLDHRGEPIECRTGEEGVIAVRGPTVMQGYRQERHNAGAFLPGGWLNTGDLGYVDADGYFWLTGRAKDIIIRGGHNISPAWIEEALYRHPAIALAAAVGKPDAHSGEVPIAYVTLKPGTSADAETLRAFALERVPERLAAPAEVIILEQMPVTAVGKIFKPSLRQDATRRAIQSALAPLAQEGVAIEVEVLSHERHGMLTRITAHADTPAMGEAVRARIEQLLSPFLGQREVVIR